LMKPNRTIIAFFILDVLNSWATMATPHTKASAARPVVPPLLARPPDIAYNSNMGGLSAEVVCRDAICGSTD